MDEVTRVSLNVWLDAIEEALEKKHDELMDLNYADEACAFYNEDEVWDIFRSCEEHIRYSVNRMRKVVHDESSEM